MCSRRRAECGGMPGSARSPQPQRCPCAGSSAWPPRASAGQAGLWDSRPDGLAGAAVCPCRGGPCGSAAGSERCGGGGRGGRSGGCSGLRPSCRELLAVPSPVRVPPGVPSSARSLGTGRGGCCLSLPRAVSGARSGPTAGARVSEQKKVFIALSHMRSVEESSVPWEPSGDARNKRGIPSTSPGSCKCLSN
ncbi:uncharacterized protein LOC131582590 isoform X2 [Poecile atricapillus]|uniref:uncharacterized protein LOC131582590 isoform X2 n=1 Tax=Poecile atricapillus TaxID=48891 RepID=UPI00273A0E82|nr:uncharacterized protein LOC131582590 isoform X2 [Poecile atricapillus]